MGRKKRVALNQVSAPPVATPEQIEEIKKEGAKMIAEQVDKQIQEDLQELTNKEPAKLLAPELESVVPLVEPPVESEAVEILREGAGLVYGDDYVDDPTIERKLATKSFEEEPNKMVVLKESVVDKRRKLRYGMKPQ